MHMCAIAGLIGILPGEGVPEKLLATMHRRGPDGSGVFRVDDCCLLHSRLAIIDPAGGAQPMTLHYGGITYTLVYNGELYNTQALRTRLMELGHTFTGHSDTEVVLHAYAEFGAEAVELFNGIFAMAVWEAEPERLFLARDRIGVKPLFYMEQGGGLIFASEIKTILAVPGVRARLDGEGAAQLLLLGPGRLPGSGIFRDIRELEPGCRAWYDGKKFRWERYWQLRDRKHTHSFPETAARVRELVLDAIRAQMVSDVPIGTFLSGGLDSSIITAVCARAMEEKGESLQTFSVDYADQERYFRPGKFQPDGDSAYIRLMQAHLNTRHHWTCLTPEQLSDALEESTLARDLPGMADVDFSLFAFCREIRRDVKVALSGECADEIFGGYPWYRDPEVRAREGFPWAQNTRERTALMSSVLRSKISGEDFVMDAYRDTCARSDILPGTDPKERRMKEMVNLNFRWFMQTLLDRKDRMSMYHGLEVRVPFCDYRIAEYLYGVPWEFKDYQGREKGLLRHAVRDLLPEKILTRKKSPYPKTFDPAYGQIMEKRLQHLLREKDSALFRLVDRASLEMLLQQEQHWPWYGQLMGRPQTMAYFVQLDFWLRRYNIELLF